MLNNDFSEKSKITALICINEHMLKIVFNSMREPGRYYNQFERESKSEYL